VALGSGGELRRAVQRSYVLQQLNDIVPPRSLLNALARIDPFPTFAGPPVPSEPPDPTVLRRLGVRAAAPSVVRVLGTACGLGVEGSGWVAAPETVVTAAHVVAGEEDTSVTTISGVSLPAAVVVFDPHDDVAVLQVPGLDAEPLRLVDPRAGAAVAIVGYPLNGPLDATPGRIGTTTTVFAQDAYGRPARRLVTSLAGTVEHGNSGGPAVDAQGRVPATVFAARSSGDGGYGVPASVVREDLARAADGPVSTGPCVR